MTSIPIGWSHDGSLVSSRRTGQTGCFRSMTDRANQDAYDREAIDRKVKIRSGRSLRSIGTVPSVAVVNGTTDTEKSTFIGRRKE